MTSLQIILTDFHPYVRNFSTAVLPTWNNRWRVKWRSFDTIKQDMDFDTREEAETFRQDLIKRARYITVGDEWDNCVEEEYVSLTEFWNYK